LDVLKGTIAREIAALEEQLDRALERAFEGGAQLLGRRDRFRPPIDVYESEDEVVVRVELAGVRGEDVRLVVDGEHLQISGRREAVYERPARRHLQMEIARGAFERVLKLRTPYDPDRVSARLEAGILTVTLPRRTPRSRSITVESG
jgi:HSP20 family protein